MPSTFTIAPQRSVAQLDLNAARSGIYTPGIESIVIDDDGVARFNVLAAKLNPEMPALSADQLAGVARRVLRTAMAGGESPFIRSRLRRAAEMRAMASDASWTLAPAVAERIGDLLAYLDDPAGLIPDAVPHIGRLDDALLVDIAMDHVREELDDYAEFCRYRGAEAARCGVDRDALSLDRASWLVQRDNELRLERQLRRVRGSNYGAAAAERIFRVC